MAVALHALSVPTAEALTYGRAPHPVSCGRDLVIGGGDVYPEINFTLPTMNIEQATWPEVVKEYEAVGAMIVKAARRMQLPGLVVEVELLPPMTEHPAWGAEITTILKRHLDEEYAASGLRSALRMTPVDLRDAIRPPLLRSGKYWDITLESFEACAAAGADILSIESVGGKEVHDEALLYGNVPGILFALGVLAPRDMRFLWEHIVAIARRHHIVPGGDSACGFANTAMQLAGQKMVPEVLAAVIRAASAVRSFVAVQAGAVGPSKDCAYEGPVLKALAGIPISMEGRSATCAHFSPVGNVAAAMCDLWSNESVQNVRLLSGYAPEAYLELLAYDCRLFNTARAKGHDALYRDILVDSDVRLSPQALVLSPASTIRIAEAIAREDGAYRQTVAAAREGFTIIREALRENLLSLSPQEMGWMKRIGAALDAIPEKEETFIGEMADEFGHLFRPESYGL
jgi:methanol--5-hydroxybenzimidazolylcobamide Co-methyltransferase